LIQGTTENAHAQAASTDSIGEGEIQGMPEDNFTKRPVPAGYLDDTSSSSMKTLPHVQNHRKVLNPQH
jgi:hypothetical protein